MRLPVVPLLSTKDGVSNKNARLTNCLKESKQGSDKAVIRPGLELSDTYSGLGDGLIVFDGRLLVIYGDTVTDVTEDSFPWPLDTGEWSSVTLYNYGDAVWYLGAMWFSTSGSNTGNTPGTGSFWARSYETPVWDEDATYAIGDPVTYGGVTYYSMAPSNSGNNPSTSPQWSTTAPTSSRYRVNVNLIAALNATTPGPECASEGAAASAWYGTATAFKSCATKISNGWVTYVGVETRNVFGTPTTFVRVTQFSDPTPFDCSGTPFNGGTIDGGKVAQTV